MNEVNIIQGDCITELKKLNDESIDLILTDPPYNTGIDPKHSRLKHFFDDTFSDDEYEELIRNFLKESYRLLKWNKPVYIFIGQKELCRLIRLIKEVGFNFKQILIWDKIIHGMNYQNYAYQHEYILFATKGVYYPKRKRITKDILKYSRANIPDYEHETIKPIPLLMDLIIDNSEKGDIVLDPFAGTGSTGEAANNLERKAILIEKETKYIEIIKKRLFSNKKLNAFF